MTARKVLLIDGHPAAQSLSSAILAAYEAAAKVAGHEIRHVKLSDLDFDMDHGKRGYRDLKPLEEGLVQVQEDITWAEHVVIAFPMWWGGLPAKLKGLFDRTLLPGFAFDLRVPKGKMPRPMLEGRTARVFITSDTPKWVERLLYKNAVIWQMKGQILKFVGIRPKGFTWYAGASDPKDGSIEKLLKTAGKLGAKAG